MCVSGFKGRKDWPLPHGTQEPRKGVEPHAHTHFPPAALAPCGAPRHGEHRQWGDRGLYLPSLAPNGVVLNLCSARSVVMLPVERIHNKPTDDPQGEDRLQ